MAIAVKLTRPVDSTQNQFVIDGTLTFSGSYPSFGDTVNFALDQFKTNAKTPIEVRVWEIPVGSSGTPAPLATGYKFTYVNGTTLANGRLQISSASPYGTAGATQITVGTYANAGLTVVYFSARIPSFAS